MTEFVPPKRHRIPTVVVVIGMAGSGKTTLMHRINLSMIEKNLRGYYVNLDPAVLDVPFGVNIDIRDTVNYKEVMSQYSLGPNGGILTSLNLFSTRFDQVIQILEKRSGIVNQYFKSDEQNKEQTTIPEGNEEEGEEEEEEEEVGLDYIFIDTPGQIETFTWSAGGQIILELLASSFPTVIMYVTDTPRCNNPTTFMSNMLYASSVLYKSQLPMIIAFNKVDIESFEFAKNWMQDYEQYQEALDQLKSEDYMTSLNRSLALAMDEFYSNIRSVGVSAATAEGIDDLFGAFDDSRLEFEETYLPDLFE